VLTREEVRALLSRLTGTPALVAQVLYGSGLRVMEGMRLRIKDVDPERREIVVRSAKGGGDRVTVLPEGLVEPVVRNIERVRELHQRDLERGGGWVDMPGAYRAKNPAAARDLAWQYIFPAARVRVDLASGEYRRHHLHETAVQRAVKTAAWRPASSNGRAATPSGTRSRPTSSRTATTSGPSKNSSGTEACAPP